MSIIQPEKRNYKNAQQLFLYLYNIRLYTHKVSEKKKDFAAFFFQNI